MPFQKEGVQCGISRQGKVMIADDMGLGKTVQALGLASHYRDAWPMLISSMRFAIGDKILKFRFRKSGLLGKKLCSSGFHQLVPKSECHKCRLYLNVSRKR